MRAPAAYGGGRTLSSEGGPEKSLVETWARSVQSDPNTEPHPGGKGLLLPLTRQVWPPDQ